MKLSQFRSLKGGNQLKVKLSTAGCETTLGWAGFCGQLREISRFPREVSLLLVCSPGVLIVCVSSERSQVRTKVSAVITEPLTNVQLHWSTGYIFMIQLPHTSS